MFIKLGNRQILNKNEISRLDRQKRILYRLQGYEDFTNLSNAEMDSVEEQLMSQLQGDKQMDIMQEIRDAIRPYKQVITTLILIYLIDRFILGGLLQSKIKNLIENHTTKQLDSVTKTLTNRKN